MTKLFSGVVPAPVRAEPTSLLSHVAGEFAPRIARLWTQPHAEFLTAPAARRHLVFLALTFGREVAGLREALLHGRLRRAIPLAVPEPPTGLERALGRLGELAWAAADYRALIGLLGHPKAAKVLRHAGRIEAELVRRLAALPAAMSGAAGLGLALTSEAVAALGEAYAALAFRDGAAGAEAAARDWASAETPKVLFERVRDDLAPEPLAPPFAGTPRLRPLGSKAELRRAAKRFRNCLTDRAPHAATGWSAYYEWEGPPGAVVEIARDHVYGWRLEEARVAGNAPVPVPARDEIVSELALMGVHVGRSGWELDRALAVDVGQVFPMRAAEHAVAQAFGDEPRW